jgi:putative SOS response-associated peptidase YedK
MLSPRASAASWSCEQWTIDPGDGCPRGFAFVWRRFDLEGLPMPLLACVMVTVPANALITRTIMADIDDPRMPAILEDADWSAWLGETAATPEAARATLKTMEGLHWQMQQEPKKPKPEKPPRPAPPPSSDPQSELF